ncbi:MAG: phosphotransferase [Nocardia sp.]|nr:phosphotransferase [Nocardia sp.]
MSATRSVLEQPLQPILAWAYHQLAEQGITVLDDGQEVRRRDWTLLAKIPITGGWVWAKASAQGFAHEGPLLQALDRFAPGSVLKPIAVHRDNGWILSPDGGETLRSGPLDREFDIDGRTPPRPPQWARVLADYADLQFRLSTRIDPLCDSGTPYLPPSRLIDIYDRFADRAPGLEQAIAAAAAELEQFGRLSIEHNDLYPGHVFEATTTFFDWGDAVITHPFVSMRTHSDPLRQAYFDAWRELAPISDREIELAGLLAPLTALHPWLGIDTTPGSPAARFAPLINELLDRLWANFA